MRFYLIVFLLACTVGRSQEIFGYIYDEAEKQPLQGANVYIDGTTIAVSTNAEGYFKINIPKGYTSPIVISYLGFESLTVSNPSQYIKGIKVYLRENSILLNEVVINKNPPFTRKEMLRAFRRQFLGTSKNGLACEIENEDDIKLWYDTETNSLRAMAMGMILIKNKRLEYDISFNLKYFNVDYNRLSLDDAAVVKSFYAGTAFFNDFSVNGSADKKRKDAYLGSVTHLMKTIANSTWDKEQFTLFYNGFSVKPEKYLAVKDTLNLTKVEVVNLPAPIIPDVKISAAPGTNIPDIKNLKPKPPVKAFGITYDKEQSSVNFEDDVIYIDTNGCFYPVTSLTFRGYMATLKAGDLLPLDYEYKD